ncbi:MAG: outer membrane protein [Granulosicoccus sp.]|jgi:outer membrane protein
MRKNTIGNAFLILTSLYVTTTSTVVLSNDCDTASSRLSSKNNAFTPDCLWLGASGSFSESEYPGQSQASAFPAIHLEHGPFYWINTAVGVVVISSESSNTQIGVAAQMSYPNNGFESDNSNELQGLDDRTSTLEGGFTLFASGRHGQLELDMGVDLEGEHDGLRASMHYKYPIQFGAFSIAPSVSLTVQDAKRSNYYYGIDSDDATATAHSIYVIDQPTIDISLGWSLNYELGQRLMLVHTVEARQNDEKINASPLTQRNTAYFSSIGVMYRFF